MPAQTAKGYPYPLGTDRVMDGDDSIHALADAVDAKQPFATWVGTASVSVVANTAANVAVTLPAGRFTQPPRISAISRGASLWFAYFNSSTTTSLSLGVRTPGGALTTTVNVDMIAVQMLATNADG